MKNKNKIIRFLLAVAILLLVAACSPPILASTPDTVIDKDREGNPITLPQTINRIISMGPSNTEILVALGFGDKIIAIDEYSRNIDGLSSGLPLFSMMIPNGEQIINLDPDIIFVTGMSKIGGNDPFKAITNAGICMIYIPSSSSIEEIKEDIRFIAAIMDAQSEGDSIIAEMEQEIDIIRAIGQTIPDSDKKSVYFEISAAPRMSTFGSNVFLNEMLDMIGAKNVFADRTERKPWFSITDEAILHANPDIILTSVNYIDDPVGEIMSRPGWGHITAVQNNEVYYIDTEASNHPSHNVIKALNEMAKAIYPDIF